jgi:hypothetical protein
MGAAQAKSVTKEVTKSDEQRNKEYNMYTVASEGFMCKNNMKDNIPKITDIIIYFLILFIILYMTYIIYHIYNGVIK